MSSLSLSLPARIVTPESFFSPFSAHSGGRIPGPKHLRSLYKVVLRDINFTNYMYSRLKVLKTKPWLLQKMCGQW